MEWMGVKEVTGVSTRYKVQGTRYKAQGTRPKKGTSLPR